MAITTADRFDKRVENYKKYRPGYPAELLDLLAAECGLSSTSIVADVGSGTGILTELLLKNGSLVYGVEPNQGMRRAAEDLLAAYENFRSIQGSAEATGLAPHNVDSIVAAQAFHWFDQEQAKTEFARILRPGGRVALVWNERRTTTTQFLEDYERFLVEQGTDYGAVDHRRLTPEVVGQFFSPGVCQSKSFHYEQRHDWEGLMGRVLSCSYMPLENDARYPRMLAELESLFARHAVNGTVTMDYDTIIYYGRLA